MAHSRKDVGAPLLLVLLCVGVATSIKLPDGWPVISETNEMLSRVAVDFAGVYLPVAVKPESPCRQALDTMLTSVNRTDWALKMVDAWGKSNDGIAYGNWFFLGMFDECVTTNVPDFSIKGKYCIIYLSKTQTNKTARLEAVGSWQRHLTDFRASALKHLLPPKVPGLRMPVSAINANSGDDLIYSTCMPNACTREDLQESLHEVLWETDIVPYVIRCDVQDPELVFTAGDIGFIIVVSLLLFLVVTASFVDVYIDYFKKMHLAKGLFRFLLPFSAYSNLVKMFHLNTHSSTTTISCLHGMRVLSMIWVIFCHEIGLTFVSTANLITFTKWTNGLLFQVITNGYPSVDTFFFLSGMLVTYSLMKELKKTNRFNIILFYVHRLIRLLPSIGLVAWMYATVARFYVNGPLCNTWDYVQRACQKYWWRDILLVNNYMVDDGDCLGQTWYIAVDCQLYLLAPLFILPLYYFSSAGKVWLYLVTLVSVITPAAITYAKDLPPTGLMTAENTDAYNDLIYFVPWSRASPWIVGIWMGYILHLQGQKKVKIDMWMVVGGWTVAVSTGLLVVFGMWSYNTFPAKVDYDVMTQVVYAGLHRAAWAAALAWVVYACHNGYGGVVDGFLSHPSWQPLSRLTYTIYLVAMSLQMAIVWNARTPYYFTHFNKVVETVGATFISVLVAVLVSLLVEGPVIGLEKLLLTPTGHRGAASNNLSKPQLPDNGVSPAVADNIYKPAPGQVHASAPPLAEYPLKSFQGQENLAFTSEVAAH
ncbi:nose resistant to fluoxetine protein 6-like isoform X2 [Panulirus ornatus]|uniref:nose resistant to fluoxetine protein 6-like isoform X2 n=1 Tax=Panulirus ornatus TaxID=150431 RepID=UPI003A8BF336